MHRLSSFRLKIHRPPLVKRMLLLILAALLWVSSPAFGLDLQRIEVSEAAANQNKMVFLDARPVKVWQQSHIPEARSFSWETYTRTDADGVPYRTFPPAEMAAALGKLGISQTDAVVIYGDADTSWGGEGWAAWALAWLGHQGPVYCLDGGFSLWRAKGLPVSDAPGIKISPKDYVFNLQPSVNIRTDEIKARANGITLVDTRNYLTEWLPGHLPGAVHIPWEKFYEGPNRRFLSTENLKALLVKNKVDLSKPVVYYCTGGIRSGFAWMVHQLAGLPDAVNFEGGTEEWNRMGK